MPAGPRTCKKAAWLSCGSSRAPFVPLSRLMRAHNFVDSSDVEIVTDLDADVEIIEASAESGVRGEAALAGLRPKKR